MLVPKCNYSNPVYRFGFQGQEKDNEIKGIGNSVNYKFSMHNPRVGRFFAVDPLAGKYPYNSTYAFQENKMGLGRELEGLELILDRTSKNGKTYYFTYRVKPVNNSGMLNDKQFNNLINKRKDFDEKVFSGKAKHGNKLILKVAFDKDATISWKYPSVATSETNEEAIMKEGEAKIGDIKNNKTELGVYTVMKTDEEGNVNYNDETVNKMTEAGSHEDGHVMGLQHTDNETGKLRNELIRSHPTTNLMHELHSEFRGTKIIQGQRQKIIDNYEKQQKEEN